MSSPLKAESLRRAWIVEQLSQNTGAVPENSYRYQLGAMLSNYVDTTSLMATVLVDLSYLEVRMRVAEKLFIEGTDEGRLQKRFLNDERHTFGFEIARQHISASGHYGRLGVEALYTYPLNQWTAHLDLETAILASEAVPWELSLGVNLFLEAPTKKTYLNMRGQCLTLIGSGEKSRWMIGGFINWTYQMKQLDQSGEQEYMLISFGPAVEHQGTLGKLRLAVPMRLWIDRAFVPGATQASYPTEATVPDVSLSWTVLF